MKVRDRNVGGHAASVLALTHASDFLVVGWAAVTIVHDDCFVGQGAQLFEGLDERGFDFQLPAAVAGKFDLREMRA